MIPEYLLTWKAFLRVDSKNPGRRQFCDEKTLRIEIKISTIEKVSRRQVNFF